MFELRASRGVHTREFGLVTITEMTGECPHGNNPRPQTAGPFSPCPQGPSRLSSSRNVSGSAPAVPVPIGRFRVPLLVTPVKLLCHDVLDMKGDAIVLLMDALLLTGFPHGSAHA